MYTLAPLVCFARVGMRLFLCLFGIAFATVPVDEFVGNIQDQYSTTWNTLKVFSDKLGTLQTDRLLNFKKSKMPQIELILMETVTDHVYRKLTDFSNLATPIEHLSTTMTLVAAGHRVDENTAILLGKCGIMLSQVIRGLNRLGEWDEIDAMLADPKFDAPKKTSNFYIHSLSVVQIAEEAVLQ